MADPRERFESPDSVAQNRWFEALSEVQNQAARKAEKRVKGEKKVVATKVMAEAKSAARAACKKTKHWPRGEDMAQLESAYLKSYKLVHQYWSAQPRLWDPKPYNHTPFGTQVGV